MKSRASPQVRAFAERLIAYEARGGGSAEPKPPAGVQVCDRLHRHLALFVGNGGFRALLSRALALASAEVPWLRDVRVNPDASFDGLDELYARLSPEELLTGKVALVAHLLELLTAFIGEDLTFRMVREAMPELPINGLEFNHPGKYEIPE